MNSWYLHAGQGYEREVLSITREWKNSDKKFSGGNSGKQKWGKIRQEEQVPYASLKQCRESKKEVEKMQHRH